MWWEVSAGLVLWLLGCVGSHCPGNCVPETKQSLWQHWAELLLAGQAEEQLGKCGFRQAVHCCSACMVLAAAGTWALIVLLFVL